MTGQTLDVARYPREMDSRSLTFESLFYESVQPFQAREIECLISSEHGYIHRRARRTANRSGMLCGPSLACWSFERTKASCFARRVRLVGAVSEGDAAVC